MGLIASSLFPDQVASHGFYAMIGMGAMIGATLQAPLAALMAMLELTANPNILLPGMLAVIAASLTSSELFGKQSVFLTQLRGAGLDYRNDPVSQSLRRIGVASVMNRNVVPSPRRISPDDAKTLLDETPHWIIVHDGETRALLPASDLVRHLEETPEDKTSDEEDMVDMVDLLGIPALRKQLAPIHLQATLQEALDRAWRKHKPKPCTSLRQDKPELSHIYGVLTRQDIEAHYLYHG